ncbi:MAG: anthranilate synthase component I family protein, partial [Phycisphaerales bacterium]
QADSPLAPDPARFTLGSFASLMGKEPYIAAVERTQAYIRAGDIYQANITHPLAATFSGDAYGLFSVLTQATAPRMGAMMAFEYQGRRHAILSISPEVFIECDFTTRTIRTEPMKGTRPLGSSIAELRDAPKDQAELNMITDLMRNDLGRFCVPGSVRVTNPRKIEPHRSGVLQATSIIEGRLNPGLGLAEIIRATFPPGSVTGAPKVRAMQIINELEPYARGPYCGSLLMLNDAGQLTSSVTIRTAHIWGEPCPENPTGILDGRCVYPVGAGIVADSVPAEEWEETLLKAKALEFAHDLGDFAPR